MISTVNLGKYYPETGVQALDSVNLTIGRGEFVCVLGPSGSGKTTLLNLIAGLDVPTSGSVSVDGHEISELGPQSSSDFRREHVGFVFQLFNLMPSLTALENVMLPLVPYRGHLAFDLEARSLRLLEEVGLADRLGHFPGQLSGGEQQRVAIARALVNSPDLVLADEPTGNLDDEVASSIVSTLGRMCKDHGATVVLATHDDRISARTSRVLLLRGGKLL